MKHQIENKTQRNENIVLSLIQSGGLWAAIFAPVIITILTFIIPFGDAITRSYILKLVGSLGGKIFLLFMISLPIWYALHQILELLHRFNMYPKRGKLLSYILAFASTGHVGYILFIG